MSEGVGIQAMISELSRQHACDGHIDIALAQRLASALAGAGDMDVRTLRALVTLQSHLIADLQTVMKGAPDVGRVDEIMAMQSAIRASVG